MSGPFFKVKEWDEPDGPCLFFRLDVGEPPEVTSPMYTDFDSSYFTHFMRLPKELTSTGEYLNACHESRIESALAHSAGGE